MKSLSNSFAIAAAFSLLSTSVCNGSNLRSRRVKGSEFDTESIECTVSEIGGYLTDIEVDAPTVLGCETHRENPIFGDTIFLLNGDSQKILQDMDITYGDIRLNVPLSAINQDLEEIIVNDETAKDIHIVQGHERRLSSTAIGNKFVLAIRVTGYSNGVRKEVSHNSDQLYENIFNYNNNNLKTLYKRCSNGKLQIKPAGYKGSKPSGSPEIYNGVIDVEFPTNIDICALNYMSAGNKAMKDNNISAFFGANNAQVDHRMIILPDCVNFIGGAAWAQVFGRISWYRSSTVALPAAQVHEFGHNLGMGHSGKVNSISGVLEEYNDPTGYMSNRMKWDEEGSIMCFNAAKTWFFGWYSEEHRSVAPSNAVTTVNLVSLDDIKQNKANIPSAFEGKSSILEIQNANGANLYVVFNRAKGINKEVAGFDDQVVIIEQDGHTGKSQWKAAISPSGSSTYTQLNWGGKTLKIENSYTSIGSGAVDYAIVKIFLIEGGSIDSDSPQTHCVDHPANWHDADGPMYNCDWYAQSTYCEDFGSSYENGGYTAQTACCACKNQPIVDPDHSALVDRSTDEEVKAKPVCVDYHSWYDQQGSEFTCDWYAENVERCKILGKGYRNFGKTAQEACCVCQE